MVEINEKHLKTMKKVPCAWEAHEKKRGKVFFFCFRRPMLAGWFPQITEDDTKYLQHLFSTMHAFAGRNTQH